MLPRTVPTRPALGRHRRAASIPANRERRAKPALSARFNGSVGERLLLLVLVLVLFVPDRVGILVGTIQLTPIQIILMIFMWRVVSRRDVRWAFTDWVVLLFIAAKIISCIGTGTVTGTPVSLGREVIIGPGAYVAGRLVGSRYDRLSFVLRWLITILALMAIPVVLESLAGINVHQYLWSWAGSVVGVYQKEQRYGMNRAMGWTSHPIMLGLTYATFVTIVLHAIRTRSDVVGRFAWLKLVCLAAGVFFSLSSGAWIAAIIGLALFAWDCVPGISPRLRWAPLFVLGPVLYFLLDFASGRPLFRILMMKLHIGTAMAWYYRWMLIERVWAVMPGFWLLGHGYNTPSQFTQEFGWSIDNNYLVILLTYGVAGVATWIAIMVSSTFDHFKDVWVADDTPRRQLVRAIRFAVIASALAQFSVALFSTASFVLWILMGVCVSSGALLEERVTSAPPSMRTIPAVPALARRGRPAVG